MGCVSESIPVRLCKGAYKEPASIAFPEKADVDANYLKLMRILFDRRYVSRRSRPMTMRSRCELWRMYGNAGFVLMRSSFRCCTVFAGNYSSECGEGRIPSRLYVPYGAAWYPYFMRRLAERPANVLFLAKSLFKG